MENTSLTLKIKDGIYDIQPPLTPELSNVEVFLIFSAVTLILSLIIYLLWNIFFSNKGDSRRQINKLQQTYTNNRINTHDAIYQLCQLLQQGLNINQISRETELPGKLHSRKNDWQHFADKLSSLRYTNKHTDTADMDKLFNESLSWLKVWP